MRRQYLSNVGRKLHASVYLLVILGKIKLTYLHKLKKKMTNSYFTCEQPWPRFSEFSNIETGLFFLIRNHNNALPLFVSCHHCVGHKSHPLIPVQIQRKMWSLNSPDCDLTLQNSLLSAFMNTHVLSLR